MGKSRRKNPFFTTAAESLKGDKQLTNRRLRHHVRQLLREAKGPDEVPDDIPNLWDVNHPSHMAKRNRKEFDPRERPTLMRK